MGLSPRSTGLATGVGSLPGIDVADAVAMVFGELPALPHLPELPDRGPGAELVGRGAGLLTSLPVEFYAGAWRTTYRPGRDLRRTRELLARDLEALTERGAGYTGPLKVQAAGPYTLAAALGRPQGGAVLHDHGATRDLIASLADGLAGHVADVVRRVPGASVVLQLDEPSLPAVLAGQVPTESGLRTLRSVPPASAVDGLRSVVAAAGVPVIVHCCARQPPLPVMRASGAAGVSVDVSLLDSAGLDAIGALVEAGLVLFAGVVPATGAAAPSDGAAALSVSGLWRRLGFAPELLAERVVVTPACGLAGASPSYARAAVAACAAAARRLAEPD